jgi:hypothetical protein
LRASFLRQWAIEGALPTYQQLSNWSAFAGGEFAYLAGSAYLEWLVGRGGDSSLVHVWRRLSAKRNRTFDEAFAGVFGEPPATLYRRFTAELTANAMAAARELVKAPADTGAIVQRLTWGTGDPAFSPDGERVAIVLRSATRPSRLVIWKTADEPDTLRARRDSAALRRDPEDVPARPIHPLPKKVIASLRPVGGMTYQGPRFLRDGRVLTWRYVARGDGTLTTDLFLWDPRSHDVHRVTRNAGVKNADPSPDGRTAIAERCRAGHCDIVRVELATGRVGAAQTGDVQRSYYAPRWSPFGQRVVVSVHVGNRWRLQMIDVESGQSRFVDPDDGASRYDASFISPSEVVAVSEVSGVPNIEIIDLVSRRSRPLTSVTGAAIAPAAHPTNGSIWFLSLYSRGLDLRRVDGARQDVAVVSAVGDALAPATMVPAKDSVVFSAGSVSAPRTYSLGVRLFRWIPAPQWSADGKSGVLALTSTAVVGKSELVALIAAGERAMWRGAALNATWRGSRVPMRLSLFDATQRPSEGEAIVARPGVDVQLTGGAVRMELSRSLEETQTRLRLGGSASRFHHVGAWGQVARPSVGDGTTRQLATIDLASAWQRRVDAFRFSAGLGTNVAYGSSAGRTLRRVIGSATSSFAIAGLLGVNGSALIGDVNADADTFEHFSLGGSPSPLIDEALIAQRIAMPALPTGVDAGRSLLAYRVSIPFATLSPFLWGASTNRVNGRYSNWHRVLGAELSLAFPPIPFAGTPAARAQVGLGRSIDEPFAKKLRGYVNLTFP